MAHFETIVRTDADRSDAFRFLRDFRNAAEWDPFVARVERVDRGALRRGSRFVVEMASAPGLPPLRFDYTLTRIERDKRLEFTAEGDRFRSHDVITIDEDEETGCVVRYDADLRPRGLWYAFDLPVHLTFQLSGRGSAAGLRRALDRLPAGA